MLLRKKIYQFSLAAMVFACGSLLFANSVLAEDPLDPNAGNLEVEFSSTPLFLEDDFSPGDNAFGYAIISNNSGNPKPIAIEAINFVNDDLDTGGKFGDGLRLIIEEDLSFAECFNGTLTEFFNEGEFLLSDPNLLNDGDSITYNFYVTFEENSNNDYQGKNLGFDVIIGFQGEESISDGDGSGGGGGLPPGLIIKNVEVYGVTSTSAKFSWFTSYDATSRVIYCEKIDNCVLNLNDNTDDPSLYGYEYTTSEMHTPANVYGVTYRGEGLNEIGITGLTSGTTYYYRAISHASPPTISRVYTFTTLALADGGDEDDNGDTPLAPLQEGNNSGGVYSGIGGIVDAASDFVGSILKDKDDKDDKGEGEVAGTVDENGVEIGGEEEGEIAGECGEYPEYLLWLIILLLLIIIALLYYIYRKHKKEKTQEY